MCADLAAVGPETVWIDLYELISVADLAGAIDQGLAKVQGRMRRAIDSFAGTLSLRLGFVGVELSKGRRDRPDPVLTVRSLLDVLVRTAEKHPTDRRLRRVLRHRQRHSTAPRCCARSSSITTATLGIVFAGSQPSTMRMLFTDQAQPFFAQADLVEIGPLADDAVTTIVEDGFEATGRAPGGMTSARGSGRRGPSAASDAARRRAVALHARRRSRPTRRRGSTPSQDVRANVDGGLERLFALLPVGHQKTLRAIAADGRVYGRTAEVLELSPGTATAAVDSLTGDGHLAKHGDRLAVIDPLFTDWIRRRFPVPS